jgi:carboxypeptidase family protein
VNPKAATCLRGAGILVLSFLLSVLLRAQVVGVTLSGTITDSSGTAVPNATIAVKHVATGRSAETLTDLAGRYTVPNLGPGDYEVSASAAGFGTSVAMVTIAAAAAQTMNLTLGRGLSLEDLGFSPAETQGNAQAQARLDRRSHMLMIHQRLGLIAAVPLLATVITGTFAGGRSTSTPGRSAHAALGSVTAGLYLASAYFAIRAPKIPATEARGPTRLHKALAWIHGPGMILTPILGAMAFGQRSRGERVHGIAGAHGMVAIVTTAAYGVSILSVSIKF